MSVFKRGKGWIAQVHDPSTGRARHLGTFPTKRDAETAKANALRTRVSIRETVDSFTNRWTTDYPRAESTNKHNGERVKSFAKAYGPKYLDSITRQQARAWALEHPGEHPALRAMFGDAMRDDLIVTNPFANLGVNRKQPKRHIRPDWLTEADLQRLAITADLVHVPGTAQIVRGAILTSAYTGIRPGELFALQHADIRDNELVISRAVRSNTRTIGPPKNGRSRTIVLPEIVAAAIAETPRTHPTLIFASPRGRQLYQSSFHGLWNPVRVAFGRPNMHYYELRHWCATYLIEKGLSANDVAVQLGHTDGGVLVQTVYAHPSEAKARDRIREAIDGPQQDHNNQGRKAQ